MKLKRYNSEVYQILDETGAVAFMALQLLNERWGAYDKDEARITSQTFDTPKQALEFVVSRQDRGGEE